MKLKCFFYGIVILLLGNCTSTRDHDTIEIVNAQLKVEIDDFISFVSEDTFKLKKVVTVSIYPKEYPYQLLLRNRFPTNCESLIGSCILNDFQVFFIATNEYSSLIKAKGKYNCRLEDQNQPEIPIPINSKERFYRVRNDSLMLIDNK